VLAGFELTPTAPLDELGNYPRCRANFSSSRLRKSHPVTPPCAGITDPGVCDPYIRLAPETRGRASSPKDELQQCRRPSAATDAGLLPLVHCTSAPPAARRARVRGRAEERRLARRDRSSKRRRHDAYVAPLRRPTRVRSRWLPLHLRERLCPAARTPRRRRSSIWTETSAPTRTPSSPGRATVSAFAEARHEDGQANLVAAAARYEGCRLVRDAPARSPRGQSAGRLDGDCFVLPSRRPRSPTATFSDFVNRGSDCKVDFPFPERRDFTRRPWIG
jgi:hypothetical protein